MVDRHIYRFCHKSASNIRSIFFIKTMVFDKIIEGELYDRQIYSIL